MTQSTIDLDSAARTFYSELDANDPTVFERRLSTEAVFVFNDVDPVHGASAIAGFIEAWKGNFRSVTHEIVSITTDSDHGSVGIEVIVRYEFPDGNDVFIKGCSFLDFASDKISGYRVYIDTSRLN
jgi:hypothetical protein